MKDPQQAVQLLLQSKLCESQAKNPGYSMRAFSQKIGVHIGALSYILNGKRNVSRKLAERIALKLSLDPQERSELLDHFPEKKKKTGLASGVLGVIEPKYLELSASHFKVAAEWEHFAVRSLIHCKGFKSSSSWIANRLGITETRAKTVVTRLLELNLIQMDSDGNLTRTNKNVRTSDDVASIAMKKHHDDNLELAKASLHRDSVSERDFTTLTMPLNPKKLSTAKELIRKFHDEFSDLLESEHSTEVYRLSVQFFPLSIIKGDSHENR